MALPSKKQQVAAVMKFLDSDRNEGRSLEEIATDIVEGYLEAITPPGPPIVLRQGMLIKQPVSNKVYRIAYLSNDRIWGVGETGGYGWLTTPGHGFWYHVEEFIPSKMVDSDELNANGKPKRKRVEMSAGDIAVEWANPDWKVGDQVSRRQRQYMFEIIATGPQSVLLSPLKGGEPMVELNKNLEKWYMREIKGASEW